MKKGVSLITLIITIIVMIILAGAVIITLNSTNTVGRASEAVFKQDLASYQEELTVYVSNQILEAYDANEAFDITEVSATTLTAIRAILPDFKEMYENIFDIKDGTIVLHSGVTGDQKTWYESVRGTITSGN